MQQFKWTVEFEVDEIWVEDGFDLTDERAQDIIEHALPFARPDEVSATVKKSPPKNKIKVAQGYKAA